jgi:hypothetical protein
MANLRAGSQSCGHHPNPDTAAGNIVGRAGWKLAGEAGFDEYPGPGSSLLYEGPCPRDILKSPHPTLGRMKMRQRWATRFEISG